MAKTMYVALLRAVNVGGNSVSMNNVREVFSSLGYADVETYLQSGNVVFAATGASSESKTNSLTKKIEEGLRKDLGKDITVLVRSGAELSAVLGKHPFAPRTEDGTKLHVTFLADRPSKDKAEAFSSGKVDSDEFELDGREVYLYCPNGYGRSKLVNSFFEKRLGVESTTRNWKTVGKLAEMAAG
jgi:uncharacterized protein (DUF1697 family)